MKVRIVEYRNMYICEYKSFFMWHTFDDFAGNYAIFYSLRQAKLFLELKPKVRETAIVYRGEV